MNNIIKCNVCKLERRTCNYVCIDMQDVSSLYIEGIASDDVLPKGYCTAHTCHYNTTGFQCTLKACVFGLDKEK